MPASKDTESNWRVLLRAMLMNTAIYGVVSIAIIVLMFTFFLPFARELMPLRCANLLCAATTVLFMAPFLRAIVMKKLHSKEFKALWIESYHNRLPLIFTLIVRTILVLILIFYVVSSLTQVSLAFALCLAIAMVMGIILSRRMKSSSIRIERLFIQNLRSRDIAAQVSGKRRPLFEGHLLDRDLHISEVVMPDDTLWGGKTLKDLHINQRFGVSVSSILRGNRRINIPTAMDTVFPGDTLSVIGTDEQLANLNAAIQDETFDEDYEIEKHEMKLERIVIDGQSKFLGKSLMESGIRDEYSCMVVGLESDEDSLSKVAPTYCFAKGDIIWIVGEVRDLARLKSK